MNTFPSLALIAVLSAAQAQSALDAARDLYANAAFEDALAALTNLPVEVSPNDARLADEYRIFALFALGRSAEAESAAEMLVRRDPAAGLQSNDASPRIQTMYDGVRRRLLPQLIREKYRSGRDALEKKEFTTAARDLTDTQRLIDAAGPAGVTDAALGDLRELVDGFLVLATAQPEPPVIKPPIAAITKPPAASRPAGAPAAAADARIYSVDDTDVTPPAALSQEMPDVPPSLRSSVLRATKPLILSLTIDERGRVRSSEVVVPMNPVYDRIVINAAKDWRYTPATRAGVPVPYQKAIAVAVR